MPMQLSRQQQRALLVKRKLVRAGLQGAVVAEASAGIVVVAESAETVVAEASAGIVVVAESAEDSRRKEKQWQNYVLNILRVRLVIQRIKKQLFERLASASCSRRSNMKISLLQLAEAK